MASAKRTRFFVAALAGLVAGAAGVGLAGADGRSEAQPGKGEGIRWSSAVLIELRVADLDRSVAFYCETLGLELESRTEAIRWARVKTGLAGATIGLGEAGPERVKGGSGGASINLGVADLDGARALLEARGVTFLGPTIEIPGVVRLADFCDPDGHVIRLAGSSSRR